MKGNEILFTHKVYSTINQLYVCEDNDTILAATHKGLFKLDIWSAVSILIIGTILETCVSIHQMKGSSNLIVSFNKSVKRVSLA